MYLRRSTRPVLPPSTVVSGGVLVPQLAGELSIRGFGAVTQYGIDVGAKRVSIRRRCHERVVEVHVQLAEERMETVVIHSCHRCIGGEVGADSSNYLSSNEQVYIGKIDVGISCSRYHEFYWTPESRDVNGWCSTQRLSSILVCVGGTAKRSSSHFTPSHDCRCMNAILRKHVCSLSSFDGSDTATRCGSFIRFTRLPGGGGVLWRLCIRFLPAAVALGFVAFWRSYQPRHGQQSALQSSVHASPKRHQLIWSEGQPIGGNHLTNFQSRAPFGHERR